MDHIDRCIVDILQHNARLPVKEIASRVSLSSPAVCARIERLEKSGVLAGYQAMINVTAIGYLVKAFINLEVEPDQKPAFYPYIESCTNVVECSCVTGDYSMLKPISIPRRSLTSLSIIFRNLDAPAPRLYFLHVWSIAAFRCPKTARYSRQTA